jgi:hypothetical protein
MTMLSWALTRLAFFGVGLAILASCTVVVDEPRPVPIPDEGPYCTREYDPVCARRGGERRTFSNACRAESAGFRVIRRGECRREGDGDFGGGPRGCTREYDPVCAQRGNSRRTFSNSCLADRAGYRIIHGNECKRELGGSRPRPIPGSGPGGGDEPRICTREYRPVCASRRGGEPRTFPNACEAEAARYRVIANRPC